MTSASRRQFNQLALAALGGALTGSVLGCSGGKQQKTLDSKSADGTDKSAASETAKTYDENLLLVGDPHVCRGLNQCKNQGKTHMNECAGQGAAPRPKSMAATALIRARGKAAAASIRARISARDKAPAR